MLQPLHRHECFLAAVLQVHQPLLREALHKHANGVRYCVCSLRIDEFRMMVILAWVDQ